MPNVRLTISIPADIVGAVQARAKCEDRNTSSMIAHLLRQSMNAKPVSAAPAAGGGTAPQPSARLSDDDFVGR